MVVFLSLTSKARLFCSEALLVDDDLEVPLKDNRRLTSVTGVAEDNFSAAPRVVGGPGVTEFLELIFFCVCFAGAIDVVLLVATYTEGIFVGEEALRLCLGVEEARDFIVVGSSSGAVLI